MTPFLEYLIIDFLINNFVKTISFYKLTLHHTNCMIYNVCKKQKRSDAFFTKIYGIDLLLNFEGNMSHRPLFLTMILYTIQNVISLNCLFSCIYFLQNYFLRFRKSGTQCWTFETSISLLVSLSMFRFFYCFNLLQQMFPAGSAEVIFLPCFEKKTKSKKRAHILFLSNVSSLFLFDTKKEHLNNLDTLDLYFF